MEWRIKLEATSGWGEVETIEVAHFKRRIVGLTAEEIGLEEAKQILADLRSASCLEPRRRSRCSAPVSVQLASRCVASAIAAR